jgi:hypothetical protein
MYLANQKYQEKKLKIILHEGEFIMNCILGGVLF